MKPYYRKPLNRTALVGVLVWVVLVMVTGAAWAQIPPCENVAMVPFECTGDAYVVQGENAQLNLVTPQAAGGFTFTPVGAPNSFEYNNLGFRVTDGLLYAVHVNVTDQTNLAIVQIDSTGQVCSLGFPPGLPAGGFPFDDNYSMVAGDFSSDGSTMFMMSQQVQNTLYKLDLSSWAGPGNALPAVTPVTISGDTGQVLDWAYNPDDGKLYGGDFQGGQLAILDPALGVRTDVPNTTLSLLTGTPFGGAWFGINGYLSLLRNSPNGAIYEIDLAGPSLVGDPKDAPDSIRNDGAACAAPAASAIELVKTAYPTLIPVVSETPGDQEVTYTFTITNLSENTLTLTSLEDVQLGGSLNGEGTCVLPQILAPAGDANGGDSYTCTVSTTITEQTINTATACGVDAQENESCDDDSARVDVYGIEIYKKPVSQQVEENGTANFTIIVKNPGSVDLTDVTVTDEQALGCQGNIALLPAGDTIFYDCTVSNVTADFTNLATADGLAPGDIPVSDDDSAGVTLCAGGPQPPNYDGCTPGFWGSTESVALLWGAAGYSTSDDFDTTFGVDYFNPDDITLGEAINGDVPRKQKKLATLARHGTSALLNEGHPDVVYEFSKDVVIGIVQAYPDAYEGYTLDDLVTANERSGTCPAK